MFKIKSKASKYAQNICAIVLLLFLQHHCLHAANNEITWTSLDGRVLVCTRHALQRHLGVSQQSVHDHVERQAIANPGAYPTSSGWINFDEGIRTIQQVWNRVCSWTRWNQEPAGSRHQGCYYFDQVGCNGYQCAYSWTDFSGIVIDTPGLWYCCTLIVAPDGNNRYRLVSAHSR